MPLEQTRHAPGCELRPDAETWLRDLGLCSAHDFLALPGVVVSGHVLRNVTRVRLGERVGYLKREHRVRHRDRFRNWQEGFGATSMSRRERIILQLLDEDEIPGPRWLACGEADGQAFLLVEEVRDAVDLRSIAEPSHALLKLLGRHVSRVHAAGVHQPDLFAKHVLVRGDEIAILDWQRATPSRRKPVDWRLKGLAALRVTSPNIDDTGWAILLSGYLEQSRMKWDDARFLHEVERLRRRPSIRKHGDTPGPRQELVRIDGETVCAIPAVAEELRHPEIIAMLYDPANHGRTIRLRNGVDAIVHVSRRGSLLPRAMDRLRGKAWRSQELRQARLLFHLERYGIPAPKLLGYGQVERGLSAASFVLIETVEPSPTVDNAAITELTTRLKSAGVECRDASAIGLIEGKPGVIDLAGLRLTRRRA